MQRLSIVVGLVGLVAMVPSAASATGMASVWWRYEASQGQCMSGAQAAFAVSGFTNIEATTDGSGRVSARAGEYDAVATCADPVMVLTIAGPDNSTSMSLLNRVQDAWR